MYRIMFLLIFFKPEDPFSLSTYLICFLPHDVCFIWQLNIRIDKIKRRLRTRAATLALAVGAGAIPWRLAKIKHLAGWWLGGRF